MRDDTSREHETDPAVAPLVEALDRLGAHERAEPDEGFEARVAQATRPGVVADIGRSGGSGFAALRWSMAAAAALVVVVGGLWVMRSPGVAPSPGAGADPSAGVLTLATIESDIDDLLFVDTLSEDGAIDSLYTGESDESADELFFELMSTEGGAS